MLMTELIHQLNAAHNGLDFIIYVIMPVQFKLLFSGSHRSRLVFFVREDFWGMKSYPAETLQKKNTRTV